MSSIRLPDEVLMTVFELVDPQYSMRYRNSGPAYLLLSRRFHNLAACIFYRKAFVKDSLNFE